MKWRQKAPESVSCNLCSSNETETYLRVKEWTLVRCRQCGLICLNPRPSTCELPELYTSEYFTQVISSDSIDLPTDERGIEARIWSQALRVRRVGQYASPPGRLLDIGCGPGYFLACAAREGWDVQGIDISRWAVDYAKEHLGLDVQVGTPDRIDELWHNDFDVITLFHLLEHLPDPLETLQAIKGALRDKGIIVITVPNMGGFEARYYGKSWRGLSIPYHLYHFTPVTITQMLGKAGFNVLTVRKQPSQLVANWIKKLIGRRSRPESEEDGNETDGAAPSAPQISTISKIYATTVGRIFTGRGMTVVARKVE